MFDPPGPPDFSDNIKPETPEAHIWIQANYYYSARDKLMALYTHVFEEIYTCIYHFKLLYNTFGTCMYTVP